MATIRSNINLNLPQNPNESSYELNRALDPVYNALRLLQRELQGTSDTASSASSNLTKINASILSLESAVNNLINDFNSLASTKITLSGNTPADSQGNAGDLWIHSTVANKTFYYKFDSKWVRVLTSADSNTAVTFSGTYDPTRTYPINTLVKATDGSVWLTLALIPIGSSPSDSNSSYLLIQEAVRGVGEAVLSSRAPAPPGSPPNFVISRLGDLVYART